MNNSVAIVTGASQGIGRPTAIRLARDFSAIVLVARNAGELREVADAVKAAGAEPLVCDLDLSKTDSAATVVKTTLDHFGRIDAPLNIAGAVPQIDLFEMTDQQWRAGTELKLHGARRLTILAWDALKKSKGSVVFMSGSATLDPKPAFAAVAAINAAIIALAKRSPSKALKTGCSSTALFQGP
jgi:3-oxoacyl-[acyl-carrier protein] reductase